MKTNPQTAMILAAGMGTRLRPLTRYLAKPLLPVGATTLLERSLRWVRDAGIGRAVVNLHHLGDQVEAYARDVAPEGLQLRFSREDPILGSGGGVGCASSHFLPGPVLIVNGDLLFDLDPEPFFQAHSRRDGRATVLAVPAERDPSLATLTLDDEDRLLEISKEGAEPAFPGRRGIFSGLHILEQEAWSMLPGDRFCSVVTEVYRPLMAQGQAHGWLADIPWYDLGTPERYEAALREWLSQ